MAFFLEEPSSRMEWLAFRKTSRLGKRRGDTIKTFAEHQVEAVLALQRALEPAMKPVNVPRTPVANLDGAEKAATNVRKRWNLGDRPVNSVTAAIEDGGGWDAENASASPRLRISGFGESCETAIGRDVDSKGDGEFVGPELPMEGELVDDDSDGALVSADCAKTSSKRSRDVMNPDPVCP